MKTIILANAPINNGNRGCVALSYCAMYLIDSVLGKGNYELYLTESLQKNGKYHVNVLGNEITYFTISNLFPHTLRACLKLIVQYKRTFRTFQIFRRANCYIFDIGQGDSFADIYGIGRFNWIDSIHRLARLLSKPYFFLPQTIGPFSDNHVKSKAEKSINKASFVMTRDKQSFDYVAQIKCNQKNVREYIDVAFFLPYTKKSFDNSRIHIGLNISALLWNGGYTKSNQFGLKCDYQKTIRDIIDYFLSMENVVLHLIPHVVEKERSIENDYAISFDLCEEYNNNRLILAPFFLSPIDAKNYISGLNFFMGARMHATIAAFSSGVPVVPMAYSRKFNGLYVDTLHYDSLVDMKKESTNEIMDIIKKAFINRYELSTIIQDRQKTIVEVRKQQLLDDLKTILL